MESKTRPGDFCGGRHAGQRQGLGRQPGVSPGRRESGGRVSVSVTLPCPLSQMESKRDRKERTRAPVLQKNKVHPSWAWGSVGLRPVEGTRVSCAE
ncbi:glutamine amidotransferase [Platysternon megacephalum]|uniref:Glutamine amidotransferase n=1 Tax=Platysternon megacephalum TaxID=55544 RepID=A0A4D9DKV2_9SAUR|nr:glutamine amidotransferase [Platysternon megacephalum]